MKKSNTLLGILLSVSYPVCAQTEDFAFTDSLVRQATELQEMGNADESLKLLGQALEIRSFLPSSTSDQIAEVINLQAWAYAMKYDWNKALKLGFDAYMLSGDNADKSIQYPTSLGILASCYAGRGNAGDYEKAIAFLSRARDRWDSKSEGYFRCLNELVYYNILNNNEGEAASLLERAIKSGEQVYKDNPQKYISELWKVSANISELEVHGFAIEYGKAVLRIMEQNNMTRSKDYIRRTLKVAGHYYQQRKFDNEIAMLETVVPICKEVVGETDKYYVDVLRKLALAYNHLSNEIRGEKRKQEEYEKYRALNEKYEGEARNILIRTGQLDEIRTYQIPLISREARELYDKKEYEKAITMEKTAYTLYTSEKDTLGIARTSSNLSNYYYSNMDKENALKYGKISVDTYDKIPEQSRNKGLAYSNMSNLIHGNGDAKGALDYTLKAIESFKQINDTLTSTYSKILGNASVYFHEVGDDRNAALYSQLSGNIQSSILTVATTAKTDEKQSKKNSKNKKKADVSVPVVQTIVYNDDMATIQWNRTVYAQSADEKHDAYSKTIGVQRKVFCQDFAGIEVQERQRRWDDRRFIFDHAEVVAFENVENDSLVMDAYNAYLIRQGMPQFVQTADTVHISVDCNSVSSQYDDSTIVVDFFMVSTSNRGNTYSAFVTRGGGKTIVVRQLFTDYDLKFLEYDDGLKIVDMLEGEEDRQRVIDDARFGTMVWKRIFDSVGAVKNIVYRPVGLLDVLDPSMLRMEDDTPLKSKFTFKKM